MQSLRQLFDSFDGQTALPVHERGERRRVYSSLVCYRQPGAFVLRNRVSEFFQQCHEIHNNLILAT